MNTRVQHHINGRLSLRAPQAESLPTVEELESELDTLGDNKEQA